MKAVFELKLMALAGYEPRLEACAVCGGEPQDPRFHLKQGALHCPGLPGRPWEGYLHAPGPGQPGGHAPCALRRWAEAVSFRLSEPSQQKMGAATEAFVLTQLERGFRTLDFYKRMEEVRPWDGQNSHTRPLAPVSAWRRQWQ